MTKGGSGTSRSEQQREISVSQGLISSEKEACWCRGHSQPKCRKCRGSPGSAGMHSLMAGVQREPDPFPHLEWGGSGGVQLQPSGPQARIRGGSETGNKEIEAWLWSWMQVCPGAEPTAQSGYSCLKTVAAAQAAGITGSQTPGPGSLEP